MVYSLCEKISRIKGLPLQPKNATQSNFLTDCWEAVFVNRRRPLLRHSRSILSGNPRRCHWIMPALIQLTHTGFPFRAKHGVGSRGLGAGRSSGLGNDAPLIGVQMPKLGVCTHSTQPSPFFPFSSLFPTLFLTLIFLWGRFRGTVSSTSNQSAKGGGPIHIILSNCNPLYNI